MKTPQIRDISEEVIRVTNPDLEGNASTTLSSAASSSDTTLTVVNIAGFSTSQYLVLGKMGQEGTEIVLTHTSTSPSGSTITLNAAISYAHDVDTPVTYIPYNQIEFSYASTLSGSKTVLATSDITADQMFTEYDASATISATDYCFARYKNSTGSTYSSYTDGVIATGYTAKNVATMIDNVRETTGEKKKDLITDDFILNAFNSAERDISDRGYHQFTETTGSISVVQYQDQYDLADDLKKIKSVTWETDPLIPINSKSKMFLEQDSSSTGDLRYYSQWGYHKIKVRPVPDADAGTAAINDTGDITATDTEITYDTASGTIPERGRMIIGSEVISYAYKSSTVFYGCKRGLEGTTAAAHSDDDVITIRNLIYSYYKDLGDLTSYASETNIPNPELLELKAQEKVEIRKNNINQARVYRNDYESKLAQLLSNEGIKQLGKFSNVLDYEGELKIDNTMPGDAPLS